MWFSSSSLLSHLHPWTSQGSQLEDVFRLLHEGEGYPVDGQSESKLEVAVFVEVTGENGGVSCGMVWVIG